MTNRVWSDGRSVASPSFAELFLQWHGKLTFALFAGAVDMKKPRINECQDDPLPPDGGRDQLRILGYTDCVVCSQSFPRRRTTRKRITCSNECLATLLREKQQQLRAA